MAELICQEMDLEFQAMKYYTDSNLAVGIHPQYFMKVLCLCIKNYGVHYTHTVASSWFIGATFLKQVRQQLSSLVTPSEFDLVEPEHGTEIGPEDSAFTNKAIDKLLSPHRFEHFSSWRWLIRGMTELISVAGSKSKTSKQNLEYPLT